MRGKSNSCGKTAQPFNTGGDTQERRAPAGAKQWAPGGQAGKARALEGTSAAQVHQSINELAPWRSCGASVRRGGLLGLAKAHKAAAEGAACAHTRPASIRHAPPLRAGFCCPADALSGTQAGHGAQLAHTEVAQQLGLLRERERGRGWGLGPWRAASGNRGRMWRSGAVIQRRVLSTCSGT